MLSVLTEAILMSTHNVPLFYRRLKKSLIHLLCASWPGAMINHSNSNYPCLEQMFMVPKVFEILKFDCTNAIMFTNLFAEDLLKPHF